MSARPRFLFNADDFGWTPGHNAAVRRAHQEGVLGRASLMANGPAFAEAVEIARANPRLEVGVHLTLCEGAPLRPDVPRLVGRDGRFPEGLLGLIAFGQADRRTLRQIGDEWEAQLRRVREAGILPSHLDSHKHVHLLPALLGIVIELARAWGVPYVRLPRPRPLEGRAAAAILWGLALPAARRLRRAGLAFADHFIGFAQSGAFDKAALLAALRAAPPGTCEVMVHPAEQDAVVAALGQRYAWARRYRFGDELAALCDAEVAAVVRAGG